MIFWHFKTRTAQARLVRVLLGLPVVVGVVAAFDEAAAAFDEAAAVAAGGTVAAFDEAVVVAAVAQVVTAAAVLPPRPHNS